jgi:hypothetical protein
VIIIADSMNQCVRSTNEPIESIYVGRRNVAAKLWDENLKLVVARGLSD